MSHRRISVLSAQVTASAPVDAVAVGTATVRAAANPGPRLPYSRLPSAGGPSSTDFRTVKYSVQDGICTIVRSRPWALNSVNFQVHCDMIAAFELAEKDDNVLAIILTGAGRYFCSGADVAGNKEKYDIDDPPRVKEIKSVLAKVDLKNSDTWSDVNMYDAWVNCSKPLIVAVNGPCIGEGFTTLMTGDVIYSADTAYFWTPFARFGVVPEILSTVEFPKRVGMNIAAEMILLSKKKTPEEMLRAGLVNEIIPGGEGFLAAVVERVKAGIDLAGDPSVKLKALRLYKSMLKNEEWRTQMETQNRREQELGRIRTYDGDTMKNLNYYKAQMPQKKKA